MDVSENSGTPKWMVKIMEIPIKMDDLGVPLFLETPIQYIYIYMFTHIHNIHYISSQHIYNIHTPIIAYVITMCSTTHQLPFFRKQKRASSQRSPPCAAKCKRLWPSDPAGLLLLM